MILHIRNKLAYRSILILAIAISLGFLWKANNQILSNPSYIPIDDFSHYWAAGRLAFYGENPYDVEKIQSLRNLITGHDTIYGEVPIAWTPPWSLIVLMPFGILPYPLARLVWLLTSVSIIMICSDILWQIYYKDRKYLWVVWIMAFLFGPSISVLQKGQITPLVLLGVTGFIYFLAIKNKNWLAGAFIGLISLKPQLFYLFWPALILWLFGTKRWLLLASTVLTVAIATLPGLLLNPALFANYIQAILYNAPKEWATPTLGGYLRLWLGIDKFYLQFLPVIAGLGWFLVYWLKNKYHWSWLKTIPILLFASILTAAYAWTYDQVILLPAILAVLSKVIDHKDRIKKWAFIGLIMAVNLLDLFLHRELDEFWFGWVAPAYLLCFIAGNWIADQNSEQKKIKGPKLQEHIE